MLDIKFIRENADLVKTGAANKNLDPSIVDQVISLDTKRRDLLTRTQDIRTQRNQLDDQLKKARTPALIGQSKDLKTQLQSLETELKAVEKDFATSMLRVPNAADPSVPVGKDSTGNVKVSEWGQKPEFSFTPKDHITLGLNLDLLDLDRGSKVGGYRGYFLKNQAVMMQLGVMRYALDRLVAKGFTPFIPPVVDRKEAFINSGHFPWGQDEAYALDADKPDAINKLTELGGAYKDAQLEFRSDTYLAGTAEVPLVSYHAGEILTESELPKTYCGFSPCYRREIGSYGKDTRGIYRIHEFMKIEQVILCTNSMEESLKWHETLATNAEEMLQELGLHYRKMLMCTGDMGEPQLKKYDLETWMPGRNDYGETQSDSIMGEFQSRRANIRYRAKDGTVKFVHMLNNTALASSRMLIALWENYQQADGSILVPQALVPYVGFAKIEKK